MINKDSKDRERNTYYYIRQVILLDTLIILKASRVSYNVDHIFPQKRYIIFKPFEKAMHVGFAGSSRLNCTTLGLHPLVPPR